MFNTINDIKYANSEAGYHFFDADTLRFFNSRILGGVIGDGYFITSEKYDYNSPRLYTIRHANADGSISTVGEFQHYETAHAARKDAHKLANGGALCIGCHQVKPAGLMTNLQCIECHNTPQHGE